MLIYMFLISRVLQRTSISTNIKVGLTPMYIVHRGKHANHYATNVVIDIGLLKKKYLKYLKKKLKLNTINMTVCVSCKLCLIEIYNLMLKMFCSVLTIFI